MPLPLEGIRVLDFSRSLAGPYCTMMLGDMGADVIKIEVPGTGDESRLWGPPFVNGESAYFLSVNRNKRSLTLNLKTAKGKEIIERLVRKSDVVVESFRPGTTARLGIDYPSVKKYNSGIVYCSISGFGQAGPYAMKPGYDVVAQAMSGIMSLTGEQDGSPIKVGVPVADIGAGMFAAYGIVSCLIARFKTGSGQYVDISLLDGQIAWLTFQSGAYFAIGKNPEKLGSAHPTIAPYQAFKANDAYFIVAVGNDSLWETFCACLSLKGLAADPRFKTNPDRVQNRKALVERLEEKFQTRPAAHWLELLEQAGVPCGPVYDLNGMFKDPHVIHREMIIQAHHSKAGTTKLTGFPVKLSDSPCQLRYPPPVLGEHTNEILLDLGYSKKELENLRQQAII